MLNQDLPLILYNSMLGASHAPLGIIGAWDAPYICAHWKSLQYKNPPIVAGFLKADTNH